MPAERGTGHARLGVTGTFGDFRNPEVLSSKHICRQGQPRAKR